MPDLLYALTMGSIGVTLCANIQFLNLVFKPRTVTGKWKPAFLNIYDLPTLHGRGAKYQIQKYLGYRPCA
jgi:hypothetical protein